MTQGSSDARWPKLLSLAVHEFRTPMTVVAGYIRMLLKERAGPLSDQQRKLLEEAEKSCGRLSALVTEMSDLGHLEGGTAPFARATVDLPALLAEVVAALPPTSDRDVRVQLQGNDRAATLPGDATRLRNAFSAVLVGLRRELVTTDVLFVRHSVKSSNGDLMSVVTIGDEGAIARLEASSQADLGVFDEWRGGCGLSLAIARRTFAAHGGGIWSPSSGAKVAALIQVPLSR
ncbi:MAG: HAMP domain-containing sensor histidine kinase [Vicinamibacterales bacterium]